MFVYTNNRKSAEDVPVRIAKGVVAIETRCTAVSHAVVQVAEHEEKGRNPTHYIMQPCVSNFSYIIVG